MTLPLDCIGLIVEYVCSVSVFKKLVLLNKATKRFLQVENPGCCMNVEFKYKSAPKARKKLKYVRNLVVVKKSSFVSENFVQFPNLTRLRVERLKEICGKMFARLPLLTHLTICSCKKLVKSLSPVSTKLTYLRVECKLLYGKKRVVNLKFLEKLKNLETLILDYVVPSQDRRTVASCFKNLSNIRTLKFESTQGINDGIFVYMPNIERLSITFSDDMCVGGFKNLKNVKACRVDNCMNICSGEEIVKALGKKPEEFFFTEPVDEDCG